MTEVAPPTTATGSRRRKRRRGALVAVVVVGLLLAVAGWLGIRGWMAKNELEEVVALQPRLSAAVAAGDLAALTPVVDAAREHASRAAALTSDPLWRATEAIPGVGANTAAVRMLADTVRDVAAATGDVLVAAQPTGGADGTIDLSGVAAVSARLDALAQRVAAADSALTALPRDQLVGPLRDAADRAGVAVAAGAPLLREAAAAANALPGMLGADGARTILVMIQNTAEVRTGGGITGSFLAIRAVDGRLEVTDHVDSRAFHSLDHPIAELPPDLVALYGEAPGRFVMNATMTPDFALSARLASAWWQSLGHAAPDTVVAVDPAVLASLLTITGPLTLSDGTVVDRGDVVEDILVRPYLEKTADEQTAMQSDLTDRLFAALSSRPLDPLRWMDALAKPVAQGRVSVWSARADEGSALAQGPLGGALARLRAAGPDAVGVFFNDATTGKMDTYLHTRIAPSVQTCRADGAADVTLAVTLRSSATGAARDFSVWMTGAANPSAPGDITTDVTAMLPDGWFLGGVEIDGERASSTDVDGDASAATLARVTLAPGQERTLTFHFVAPRGVGLQPVVMHTPMMNDVAVEATSTPGCG